MPVITVSAKLSGAINWTALTSSKTINMTLCICMNKSNIIMRGRVSYSIYCSANTLQIIKFEWFTQTNCETHQFCSWVVPRRAVLDQLLANTHLNYKVAGLQFTRIYGFNYPQRVCTAVYRVARILSSLSLLLYTLGMKHNKCFVHTCALFVL